MPKWQSGRQKLWPSAFYNIASEPKGRKEYMPCFAVAAFEAGSKTGVLAKDPLKS